MFTGALLLLIATVVNSLTYATRSEDMLTTTTLNAGLDNWLWLNTDPQLHQSRTIPLALFNAWITINAAVVATQTSFQA